MSKRQRGKTLMVSEWRPWPLQDLCFVITSIETSPLILSHIDYKRKQNDKKATQQNPHGE